MAVTFGVTSTGGYGVLNTLSETQTAEIAECRNALGKVTDQKAYSKTLEATSEGVFNGDSLAGAGTSLKIGSVTGLITSQQKSESNTDYQRISVTVQKKDAASQAAYSS